MVSRHLRAIEQWLGVPLVERGPTGTGLTDEGRAYHEVVAQALDDIAHATLDLLSSGFHNRVHIHCAPGFALHWLVGHMGAFEQANPQLDIELRPSDDGPDFTSHEADIDIRFNATYENAVDLPPLLQSRIVAEAPIIAVASPEYLEKASVITCPHDLIDHQLLHESTTNTWGEWLRSFGIDQTDDLKGPRLWQGHITLDAAKRGRGVALANPIITAQELVSGALIDIGANNPEFPERVGHYIVIMRKDRGEDPAVRRFRKWLARTIANEFPEFKPSSAKRQRPS